MQLPINKKTIAATLTLPDQIGDVPSSHWGDFAASYDSAMDRDPAMCAIRSAVAEAIPDGPGHVLDLGAGTGALTFLLRQKGKASTFCVVDPEQAMLDIARSTLSGTSHAAEIDYRIGSGQHIPYPDETFDFVVTNFSLHHIPNVEKQGASDEIYRVLKSGGKLIFGDQFCLTEGTVGTSAWSRELLDIFVRKAYWYLEHASFERMLLQMKILPRILCSDGEHVVPDHFWTSRLETSGFVDISIMSVEPVELLNKVIAATK